MRKIFDKITIVSLLAASLLLGPAFGQPLKSVSYDDKGIEKGKPDFSNGNELTVTYFKTKEIPYGAMSVFIPDTIISVVTWRKEFMDTWLSSINRLNSVSLDAVYSRYPIEKSSISIGDLGTADLVVIHNPSSASGQQVTFVFYIGTNPYIKKKIFITWIFSDGKGGYTWKPFTETDTIRKYFSSFKWANPEVGLVPKSEGPLASATQPPR